VKEVKLIIRINQADKPSILRGISPKNDPPLRISSIPPGLKPFKAKKLVIKAIINTKITLMTGLILAGTSGIANIPEINSITIVLRRKPINSLPS
jgi:hypothetical protein